MPMSSRLEVTEVLHLKIYFTLKQKDMVTASRNSSRLLFIAIIVVTSILAYRGVLEHDFINYDDPLYVTQNPAVRDGVSVRGFHWALSSTVSKHWHPVTWLSHMLDVDLFNLDPRGHHASSLLIHTLNAVLVLLLVQRWMPHGWQSLLAALLFSIHPLRVESVAWVADRKDLLATFFFILSLLAYSRYAQRPNGRRYFLVLLLYVLGLMSKALLVVMPLILLLLDYWPLRRVGGEGIRDLPPGLDTGPIVRVTWKGAFAEKLPLIGLSAGISVLAIMLQESAGNLQPLDTVPLSLRLSNGLWSYLWYIWKSFAPVGLTVFYPIQIIFLWKTVLALLLITGITLGVLWFRRSHPYAFMGWGWFLVGLTPVLGVVQVGSQARADRYSYLPLIGLCIAAAFAISDAVARNPRVKSGIIGAVTAYVFIMAALTREQVRVWSNSQTVFEHAIRWDPTNHIAHNNLGVYLLNHRQTEDAVSHLEQAVIIAANYPEAYYNLGCAHLGAHRIREAGNAFSKALALRPGYAEAYNGLGLTLYVMQDFPDALEKLNKALELRPDFVDALVNRAAVLVAMERRDEAVLSYQQASEILPNDVGILENLADTLVETGDFREAAGRYSRILQLEPGHPQATKSLQSLLEGLGTSIGDQSTDRKATDE